MKLLAHVHHNTNSGSYEVNTTFTLIKKEAENMSVYLVRVQHNIISLMNWTVSQGVQLTVGLNRRFDKTGELQV